MSAESELIASASCYMSCLAGVSVAQAAKIALLAGAVQKADPQADVTPQALSQQAQCFMCHGISQGDAVEILLLSTLFAEDDDG